MPLDIKNLEDSEHLLDVLLQCEDILDSLDMYCFQNWFTGEVVEGPIIKRHWVTIGLLYPLRKMPDPRAALRLMKHGIKVEFKKVKRQVDQTNKPAEHHEEEEDHEKNRFWMVELKFPRRLLKDIMDDLEQYDDEVDADDVEQAKDTGVDMESAFQDGDENGDFIDPSEQPDAGVPPPAGAPPQQQQPQQPGGF